MSAFASPTELAAYLRETACVMMQCGMSGGGVLHDVSLLPCTTSSEWLLEIGAAVRSAEAAGQVPVAVQRRLDRIMEAVHVAYPTM